MLAFKPSRVLLNLASASSTLWAERFLSMVGICGRIFFRAVLLQDQKVDLRISNERASFPPALTTHYLLERMP